MKSLSPLVPAFLLTLAFPAVADTFLMKDGSTLEGTILSENETSYVVEVQVTRTIKDERTIAKAGVAKVEVRKPDLIAFAAISALVPAPDFLSADQYVSRIRAVEKFLSDHPGSSKTKDAREILTTLQAEANEILAGGIKLNGNLVPAAEYQANAYEFDSRVKESEIRNHVKEARYLQALRAFSEMNRDYHNTQARAALLPLINQVMTSYLAGIEESLATLPARLKEREIGLQRMAFADRRSTEAAIAEETAAIEARFKSEKDAKLGWVTTHPFFKKSLDETMAFGKQELARLAASSKAPAIDGGKVYREALHKIQGGADAATVMSAINAAKTAMVPPKYIAVLKTAAANR